MNILNEEIYISRMAKSMYDKLFFVDKIFENVDTIVDFGCADGTLLKLLKPYFPMSQLIGYDNNPDMIRTASNKLLGAYFTTDWNNIKEKLKGSKSSILVLSSVMHEVYSYCTVEEIEQFWQNIKDANFKYIVVRDIGFNEKYNKPLTINISDIRIKYESQIKDYEQIYGTINTIRNLTHFLLKYTFIENWERELKENYFSVNNPRKLFKKHLKFDTIYYKEYCLFYTKNQIKKDTDIDITVPTHYQLILKRR